MCVAKSTGTIYKVPGLKNTWYNCESHPGEWSESGLQDRGGQAQLFLHDAPIFCLKSHTIIVLFVEKDCEIKHPELMCTGQGSWDESLDSGHTRPLTKHQTALFLHSDDKEAKSLVLRHLGWAPSGHMDGAQGWSHLSTPCSMLIFPERTEDNSCFPLKTALICPESRPPAGPAVAQGPLTPLPGSCLNQCHRALTSLCLPVPQSLHLVFKIYT